MTGCRLHRHAAAVDAEFRRAALKSVPTLVRGERALAVGRFVGAALDAYVDQAAALALAQACGTRDDVAWLSEGRARLSMAEASALRFWLHCVWFAHREVSVMDDDLGDDGTPSAWHAERRDAHHAVAHTFKRLKVFGILDALTFDDDADTALSFEAHVGADRLDTVEILIILARNGALAHGWTECMPGAT